MKLVDFMPNDVKKKLQHNTFSPGEIILHAETENDYVHFLIDGMAEAYIPNSQGGFSTVHIYKPGSFFGEAEQFYTGRKSVEISAMTPCIVDKLHRNDFFDWMKKDFEVTKLIIKEIVHKLILNSEYIEEISQLTVKECFLRCIATHYQLNNIKSLTKEEVAKETKSPVRSINRAIAACTKEGILCYKNRQIYILDKEKLQTYLR